MGLWGGNLCNSPSDIAIDGYVLVNLSVFTSVSVSKTELVHFYSPTQTHVSLKLLALLASNPPRASPLTSFSPMPFSPTFSWLTHSFYQPEHGLRTRLPSSSSSASVSSAALRPSAPPSESVKWPHSGHAPSHRTPPHHHHTLFSALNLVL